MFLVTSCFSDCSEDHIFLLVWIFVTVFGKFGIGFEFLVGAGVGVEVLDSLWSGTATGNTTGTTTGNTGNSGKTNE